MALELLVKDSYLHQKKDSGTLFFLDGNHATIRYILEFFVQVNQGHDDDRPIKSVQKPQLTLADADNFGGVDGKGGHELRYGKK